MSWYILSYSSEFINGLEPASAKLSDRQSFIFNVTTFKLERRQTERIQGLRSEEKLVIQTNNRGETLEQADKFGWLSVECVGQFGVISEGKSDVFQ